ncbi:hypothetical protein NLI96_g816 [Meripilus lineatus]|uniref:Required for respiratory growth protein 9, mitochondrial n=1 Tax=Meripilus lineatus TaxID=2056292 RepID=A0AAD5VD45_9APHY|nr:hypothetical protein NLI96_g816 [Physisporinus lineatus]
MFSVLRTAAKTRVSSPLKPSDSALYTTIAGLTRQTWKTTARPPKALAPAEQDEAEFDLFERPEKPRSSASRKPPTKPTPHQFSAHRARMKQSFPGGWAPPRKLSRDAMDGLRSLHAHDPETFTTPVLANKFQISPEAVRRILKSKWEPSAEKRQKLLQREREQRTQWIAERNQEERRRLNELEGMRRSGEEVDVELDGMVVQDGEEGRGQGQQRRYVNPYRGARKGDRLSLT